MGRHRGKSKKLNDESDEDGSVGGEEVSVSPTPPKTKRRRGRPAQKPLTADDGTDGVEAEEDKDAGEVEEEDADDVPKPALAVRRAGNDDDDAKGSTAETGAAKKRRRRRARVKRGSDDDLVGEDGVGDGRVRAKSSGFRPNGSRRKSTPRRAAEAGVDCK
ncbi:unnamed protein product [Miscanthus lutarioriparius]|uniref:Uncharacterized protein n=1 Tax=Miscanthus lutarioriparius TaxID=422564 RepID=A0A811R3N2_9POAL|nr:unnamed protein product [Miscanthus lutarioriparius]